jgi:hypothetical protein
MYPRQQCIENIIRKPLYRLAPLALRSVGQALFKNFRTTLVTISPKEFLG